MYIYFYIELILCLRVVLQISRQYDLRYIEKRVPESD